MVLEETLPHLKGVPLLTLSPPRVGARPRLAGFMPVSFSLPPGSMKEVVVYYSHFTESETGAQRDCEPTSQSQDKLQLR